MTESDTARKAREAGFVCDGIGFAGGDMEDLARFEALVRADERERCAKVCEDKYGHVDHIALSCAAAIRSGGGGSAPSPPAKGR